MGNGAGVAQIITEAGDLLSLYSKRLQVLRDVFEQSGEWDALQISRQLNDILIENSESQKRLQRVRDSGSSDVLVDVWNISRMKLVYHPVLKDCLKSTALCATWKNRPEILSLLEQKNREIMGDQYHRYVNTSIFPSFVKDHLFHLFGLITNYNAKNPTPLLYRLENLIEWLNNEQPTINSIKGFPVSSMPNPLRRVDDLVLKMDTFRLPQCDANDAEKCDVILSSRHVIVRTVRGKIFRKDETVEHQAVALINLQEAYDDASFEILGIGFTKVLTADSPRTREDWVRSIREVQRFQSGVSSY